MQSFGYAWILWYLNLTPHSIDSASSYDCGNVASRKANRINWRSISNDFIDQPPSVLMWSIFTTNESFESFVHPRKSGRQASSISWSNDEIPEVSSTEAPVGNEVSSLLGWGTSWDVLAQMSSNIPYMSSMYSSSSLCCRSSSTSFVRGGFSSPWNIHCVVWIDPFYEKVSLHLEIR